MASKYLLIVAIVSTLLTLGVCIPKTTPAPPSTAAAKTEDPKQLASALFGITGKETSSANFMRLLVMRIIYGIASTMGAEERLSEMFNGAFVPPGEDDGDYGLDFGGIDEIFDDR